MSAKLAVRMCRTASCSLAHAGTGTAFTGCFGVSMFRCGVSIFLAGGGPADRCITWGRWRCVCGETMKIIFRSLKKMCSQSSRFHLSVCLRPHIVCLSACTPACLKPVWMAWEFACRANEHLRYQHPWPAFASQKAPRHLRLMARAHVFAFHRLQNGVLVSSRLRTRMNARTHIPVSWG